MLCEHAPHGVSLLIIFMMLSVSEYTIPYCISSPVREAAGGINIDKLTSAKAILYPIKTTHAARSPKLVV